MKSIKSGVRLKSNIPKDILLAYIDSYNKISNYRNKIYLTDLEFFELSLARDFVRWVNYYYGI